MYWDIRQETHVPQSKFGNNFGNVSAILWTSGSRVRLYLQEKREQGSGILTSIPLCCRPSNTDKPSAFNWAGIFIERRVVECALCERHQLFEFEAMTDIHLGLISIEWLKIWHPVHPPESKLAFSSDLKVFTRYRRHMRRLTPTWDIKHCFTTKSRMSNGPSLHQQNRTSRCLVFASMSPFLTKNTSRSINTCGNSGAALTCDW